MEYRQLGRSELRVSEVSLGSWLTYGVGVDTDAARACVEKAFDVGINFFDTANVYGRGAAEEFLGQTLAGLDRSSYVLATKVYFPMSPRDRGLSAAQIHKQLEASLGRLRTDYVDLYQCHRYDRNTPLEETMRALTDVVSEGKARFVGISEWNAHQIRAGLEVPDVVRIVSSQPQYSMLWRRPEKDVFPLCEQEGIGNVVWSPLAQGVLTGKYQPGSTPPADSRAASKTMGQDMGRWRDVEVLDAVQGLKPIADQAGVTMAQLALAWVLRLPVVSSAIIGATRPEQVEDNAAASGVTLPDDVLKAIDDALGPVLSGSVP
ncbi:MAG: aldo/keto reductase family protein [Acidimicrobiia bacterium]|nr:aldo/keto reductase family protein [Acidimicrobiia bacterium]